MVELEGGVGSVGIRVERRGLDEPRVARRAQEPCELAGNDPAGVVNQPFRQNDCRRQIMPRVRECARNRRD